MQERKFRHVSSFKCIALTASNQFSFFEVVGCLKLCTESLVFRYAGECQKDNTCSSGSFKKWVIIVSIVFIVIGVLSVIMTLAGIIRCIFGARRT